MSTMFAPPHTPPPHNRTVPVDSPSNPFGRMRRLTLSTTLPSRSPFSKHLPLRFQVHYARAVDRELDKDGTYRVVQVPLNYTLAHLRKLIYYIFDPATDAEIVKPYSPQRSSSHTSNTAPLRMGDHLDSSGHLFEIQWKIKLGSAGRIKEAQTWVKASTIRDPHHYPGNESEKSPWVEDKAEGDEWKWEAEEDFTLSKVWPKGGDFERGMVYHHSADIKIDITLNTKKLEGRVGIGNEPFLFLLCGSVSLSNPHGTLRMGSIETLRWNRTGAFERYLKAEDERERAVRRNVDREEDGECELDTDYVPIATPPLLYEPAFSPFTKRFNPVTPRPTKPSTRRRIDYEQKRLLRLMKEGLKDAGLFDE